MEHARATHLEIGCLNCSGKTGECTSCPSGKVVSGTERVDGTVVVIEMNSNIIDICHKTPIFQKV